MEASKIYMSPVYDGKVTPVTLEDEYGKINIWMLPFVKPVHVRRFNEEAEISSYTDAMRVAIDNMHVDSSERNIMITHQFVTGADRTESEDISVGGTDNVDVSVFDAFDYTALGHLHRPQNCTSEKVRYSGTPLKYSFSEAKDHKSVTVVELKEKDNLTVDTISLKPLRDMVEIKGKYEDIILRDFYKGTSYQEDYVHITLTDEEDIMDVIGRLRTVYHNLMKLDYDNLRTKRMHSIDGAENIEKKSPYEHFADFYEKQNNQPMNEEQSAFMQKLIEEIWEGER
jgi:exonuclease SbcD